MSEAHGLDMAAAIRGLLAQHLPADWHPANRDIVELSYLIDRMKGDPKAITYGDLYREAAGAIRVLFRVMPQIIDESRKSIEDAKAKGIDTDLEHFIWRAEALLKEAKHFELMTVPRDRRGWWHGWARLMRATLEAIKRGDNAERISFQKDTGRGIEILRGLLKLAGMEDVTPSQVVSALRER